MLFATGLDQDRSTVFVQSHVQAHAEAAWLLSSVTSFGELRRMTQFKEKSEEQEFVSAGLFTYPVLMAGDILLYQTDIVPIGDDQRQHLELARNVASVSTAASARRSRCQTASSRRKARGSRICRSPSGSMSTTRGAPQGVVRMVDPPDVVRKKFKTAVTDSGSEVRHDPDEKPGVSNLIEIMAVATGRSISDVEAIRRPGLRHVQGGSRGGGGRAAHSDQQRYDELRADEGELRRLLALGADKAREASAPTLEAMYERMGFVRP